MEAEKIADRIVMKDIRDAIRKMPETVHGAVKECMDFELGALKKDFEKHIQSDDPHPAVKKSKRAKRQERIKLAIAASGSAGLIIVLKIVLGAFHINI